MTEISIDVTLKHELLEAEPTGDPCVSCHDVPYLAAKRFVCYASVYKSSIHSPMKHMEIYLCPSCAEMLQDFLKAHA